MIRAAAVSCVAMQVGLAALALLDGDVDRFVLHGFGVLAGVVAVGDEAAPGAGARSRTGEDRCKR